jgi:HD superfamily phosphodiesterase
VDSDCQEIWRLAKPFLETRDNVIHTQVACSFARKLLAAEGGNEAVVIPAVILHDVGWKSVPEDLQLKAFGPGANNKEINRIHEVEGARVAAEILSKIGYDLALTQEIVEIVRGHDSRKVPLSLNDKIVKDSDKLWRFSAEALEVDPKRFGVDPAVHVRWLGLQIDKWFFTPTGKRLAFQEQNLRAISLGIEPQKPDDIP